MHKLQCTKISMAIWQNYIHIIYEIIQICWSDSLDYKWYTKQMEIYLENFSQLIGLVVHKQCDEPRGKKINWNNITTVLIIFISIIRIDDDYTNWKLLGS